MKKLTFFILCLIFLNSCQQEEMYPPIRTDKEIIQTAKNQYSGQFESLSDYNNLYSNPLWEKATKFGNNSDTVSFYVPLMNEVERRKSYLIINAYDYKQTYFILRIPEAYQDMDTYIKDKPAIGVVRRDKDFLNFIGDVKEIIAKRIKVSCTGGEGSSNQQKPGKNDKCEYNSEDNPIELGEVIIPGTGPGSGSGSSWWEDTRPPRPDETNPPGSSNVFPGGTNGGGANNSKNMYNGWDLNATNGPLGSDYPWNNLTIEEKRFVIDNPIVAKQFYNNAQKAATAVYSMAGQHNGIADAVRHAYWSALNFRDHGDLAKRYGNAHEANPNQPILEKQMDLHNNNIGYEIGKIGRGDAITSSWSDQKIYNEVIKARDSGKLQLGL